MKKLFASVFILFISYSLYSQDYFSDKQYYILKNTTETLEANAERLIQLDKEKNKITIQVLSGKTITRNVKFVESKYEDAGVTYDGYYETTSGEKIYIKQDEIVFEANRTLGAEFTYKLK